MHTYITQHNTTQHNTTLHYITLLYITLHTLHTITYIYTYIYIYIHITTSDPHIRTWIHNHIESMCFYENENAHGPSKKKKDESTSSCHQVLLPFYRCFLPQAPSLHGFVMKYMGQQAEFSSKDAPSGACCKVFDALLIFPLSSPKVRKGPVKVERVERGSRKFVSNLCRTDQHSKHLQTFVSPRFQRPSQEETHAAFSAEDFWHSIGIGCGLAHGSPAHGAPSERWGSSFASCKACAHVSKKRLTERLAAWRQGYNDGYRLNFCPRRST